jgi:hypothetical protein
MKIDGSDYFLRIPEQQGQIQLQPLGASITGVQVQLAPNDDSPPGNDTWHIEACPGNHDPYGYVYIGSAGQDITGSNLTVGPNSLLEALTGTDGTQRAYLVATPNFCAAQDNSWSLIPQGNGYWIMNDNNCLTAAVGAGQGNDAVLESCSIAATSDQVWTITQSST